CVPPPEPAVWLLPPLPDVALPPEPAAPEPPPPEPARSRSASPVGALSEQPAEMATNAVSAHRSAIANLELLRMCIDLSHTRSSVRPRRWPLHAMRKQCTSSITGTGIFLQMCARGTSS